MRIGSYGYRANEDVLNIVLSRFLLKKFNTINMNEREIMASIAVEDFVNYYSLVLGIEEFEDSEDITRDYIENMFDKNPTEIINVIDEWMDVWIWKWRQRVKLVMKPQINREVDRLEVDIKNIMPSIKNLKEIKRFAIGSLIRNNEVCFTNLLADNIVKSIVYKFFIHVRDAKRVSKILNDNKYIFVNEIINRVKSLKKFKGQLIIINVSDQVFNEKNSRYIGRWKL